MSISTTQSDSNDDDLFESLEEFCWKSNLFTFSFNILGAVLCILSLFVALFAAYNLCNRVSCNKINKLLIITTTSCNILFVVASVFYWILLYVADDCKHNDSNSNGGLYNSLAQNSGLVGVTSYSISLALLFIMLSKRLAITFNGTMYALSKTWKMILYSYVCIMSCTIPFITYLFLIWNPWAFYLGGMVLGTYTIMSIVLLSLFVKKLRQITSLRLVSAHLDLSAKASNTTSNPKMNMHVSTSENSGNSNSRTRSNDPTRNTNIKGGRSPSASSVDSMEKYDFDLIQIMTRYTILVFFAVMTTTAISVVSMCRVFATSPMFFYIASWLVIMDSTLNIVCLTLQFKFANKMYHKLCFVCNNFVNNQCVEMTVHSAEKSAQRHASIDLV